MLKEKRLLIVFLVLMLVAGCATIRGDWRRAEKVNTVKSYQEFLRQHSKSDFAAEATIRIEKLDWEEAKNLNSASSYRWFIHKHPQSSFVSDAKIQVEKKEREKTTQEWEKTTREGTIEAYESFLTENPNSIFQKDAYSRIEELDFASAKAKNTISSYNDFLKRYPNSKFANYSQKMKESLLRIQTISSSEEELVKQIFEYGPNSRFVVKDLEVQKMAQQGFTSITIGGPSLGTSLVIFEENKEKGGYSIKSNISLFGISPNGFQERKVDFSNLPKGAITRFLGRIEFGTCSLETCIFKGDLDNPLTFVWVPDQGFVFLSGDGYIELKSGERITLPMSDS